MKLQLPVPFYENFPDADLEGGSHCLQAAYKSILAYFLPNKTFTWEKLDEITGKVDGDGTWSTKGLLWMQQNGFEVQHWTCFDYERLIKIGFDYFYEIGDEDWVQYQISDTNLISETKLIKEMLKKIEIVKQVPTLENIKELIANGNLIKCMVNSNVFENRSGFWGHAVLVVGFDEESIIYHDPGYPGEAFAVASNELFMEALLSEGEIIFEMDVFRYKQNSLG